MSYSLPLNSERSQVFQNFLQEWVVGISNLPSELVRPRWQAEPPPRPTRETRWLAFGVVGIESDASPYQDESPPDPAHANLQWVERFEILLSFYGVDPYLDAISFRNTACIEANTYPLTRQNVRLQKFGDIALLHEPVNELWYARADLPMTIERGTVRIYEKTQAAGVTTSLRGAVSGTLDFKIGAGPNGKPQP